MLERQTGTANTPAVIVEGIDRIEKIEGIDQPLTINHQLFSY